MNESNRQGLKKQGRVVVNLVIMFLNLVNLAFSNDIEWNLYTKILNYWVLRDTWVSLGINVLDKIRTRNKLGRDQICGFLVMKGKGEKNYVIEVGRAFGERSSPPRSTANAINEFC